ncbi:helix-turn-helix transcriptional regulator [Curtobacterium sp. MCBD17_013]|uniref:helix-turn-helix transcriptional regulator n=1 Tax=Curtobacterium sp. MCBD17_013 TaxID=2175668 RepID=UPI0011B6AEEA|nr:helix-turn-helix transcriptional regulator [Curtobacterium sp. MCBD17_013]
MTQVSGQPRSTEEDGVPTGRQASTDHVGSDHVRVLRLRHVVSPEDHGSDHHLLLLPPGEHDLPATLDVLEAVSIQLAVLHRVARTTTGNERLRLPHQPARPVGTALARYWASAAAHARAAAALPGVEAGSIVRTTAEESLAAATIAAFELAPVDAGLTEAPLAVRRAVAFMEEHAGAPITITDVAAAAHMSVRGLQSAFRRALGSTPLEYLRSYRLRSAHADLVAADPSRGDSVAAIATRWGLMHAGRFSQRYRERFGESPMTTLHR